MTSRRLRALFATITIAAVVMMTVLVTTVVDEPYDPLVFPLQTVHEVTADAVIIDGALCNTDSELVEAEVHLSFAPETRGRPIVPIFSGSVQDYEPGCEVHHHACASPGDNGLCAISVCQDRLPALPSPVSSCHPAFVNTFTDEVYTEAVISPRWRVVGAATPLAPHNGETEPIQSEVFEVTP